MGRSEFASILRARDIRHLVRGASTQACSSKVKTRAGGGMRSHGSEKGLEVIDVCAKNEFRILKNIVRPVGPAERHDPSAALLQHDGARTVVGEIVAVPVLRRDT